MEIRRRTLGEDYHDTLRSRAFLAGVERELGHLPEAERLFRDVQQAEHRVLGPEHPDTLEHADEYAEILISRQKWSEAVLVLTPTIAIRAKTAPDDWRLAYTRCLLGAALVGLQRMNEAEPLLQQGNADLAARAATIPPLERKVLATAEHYRTQLSELRQTNHPR